jgi:hypothetical protein
MKRFFGMMPCSEIELTKTYVDSLGLNIRIEVGKNGWTITYADSSTEYKDVVDTVENNLAMALKVLESHLTVTEVQETQVGYKVEEKGEI